MPKDKKEPVSETLEVAVTEITPVADPVNEIVELEMAVLPEINQPETLIAPAELPVFEVVETEKAMADADLFDSAMEEVSNALKSIGVSEGALFKVFGVMPDAGRAARRAARQAKRAANKGPKNKKAVV